MQPVWLGFRVESEFPKPQLGARIPTHTPSCVKSAQNPLFSSGHPRSRSCLSAWLAARPLLVFAKGMLKSDAAAAAATFTASIYYDDDRGDDHDEVEDDDDDDDRDDDDDDEVEGEDDEDEDNDDDGRRRPPPTTTTMTTTTTTRTTKIIVVTVTILACLSLELILLPVSCSVHAVGPMPRIPSPPVTAPNTCKP